MVEENSGLIRQAQKGDIAAFETLYYAYKPYLCQVVGRFDFRDVDNEVQEIFLKIWYALPSFEWRSKFITWITAIAIRHCLSRLRTRSNGHMELLLSEMAAEGDRLGDFSARLEAPDNSEEIVAAKELSTIIQRSLSQFTSAKDREAFLINQLREIPEREAAAIIGCTVGQLRARVARAKARLKLDLTRIFRRSI